MRRGQKSLKSIPNHRKSASLAEIAQTVVYGCELPPKATLAHKYIRVLKRLAKGAETLIKTVDGACQWFVGAKRRGYVKNGILNGLRALGLAQCIGSRWLITSAGRKAIGVA